MNARKWMILPAMAALLIAAAPLPAYAQDGQPRTVQEVASDLAPSDDKNTVVAPSAPDATIAQNTDGARLARYTNEMANCTTLRDRMLRLRCYDDISTQMGLMAEEVMLSERERLGAYGFWQVLSEKDPLGVETIYLTMAPYNRLLNPTLASKTPTLNIRCRQGNTDLYIDWKSSLNGNLAMMRDIYVFTRIDNDQEYRTAWPLSLDAFAAFTPDPVSFIKMMRGKRLLLVRITPHLQQMETLAFQIGNLEQALEVLVNRCYADGSAQQGPAQSDLRFLQ